MHTLYVIPCQHHTDIGTDMQKNNRQKDIISIPLRSYVSLNGYVGVFVHKKTLDRVLLCLFLPY